MNDRFRMHCSTISKGISDIDMLVPVDFANSSSEHYFLDKIMFIYNIGNADGEPLINCKTLILQSQEDALPTDILLSEDMYPIDTNGEDVGLRIYFRASDFCNFQCRQRVISTKGAIDFTTSYCGNTVAFRAIKLKGGCEQKMYALTELLIKSVLESYKDSDRILSNAEVVQNLSCLYDHAIKKSVRLSNVRKMLRGQNIIFHHDEGTIPKDLEVEVKKVYKDFDNMPAVLQFFFFSSDLGVPLINSAENADLIKRLQDADMLVAVPRYTLTQFVHKFSDINEINIDVRYWLDTNVTSDDTYVVVKLRRISSTPRSICAMLEYLGINNKILSSLYDYALLTKMTTVTAKSMTTSFYKMVDSFPLTRTIIPLFKMNAEESEKCIEAKYSEVRKCAINPHDRNCFNKFITKVCEDLCNNKYINFGAKVGLSRKAVKNRNTTNNPDLPLQVSCKLAESRAALESKILKNFFAPKELIKELLGLPVDKAVTDSTEEVQLPEEVRLESEEQVVVPEVSEVSEVEVVEEQVVVPEVSEGEVFTYPTTITNSNDSHVVAQTESIKDLHFTDMLKVVALFSDGITVSDEFIELSFDKFIKVLHDFSSVNNKIFNDVVKCLLYKTCIYVESEELLADFKAKFISLAPELFTEAWKYIIIKVDLRAERNSIVIEF